MDSKIRLRYSKTGRAKYISHLDLMATMRRALLRAGIKLKYSEGFNPHPYMSVALPLSVGCGSFCELMDIGVVGNELQKGLPEYVNAVLPEGLEILAAYTPERKFNSIAWIEINGLLHYDAEPLPGTVEKLAERFAEESIVISKKTKRGISDIDIAPYIRDVSIIDIWTDNSGKEHEKSLTASLGIPVTDSEFVLKLSARISAQNPSINPENLMSALQASQNALAPDYSVFTRIDVFDKDMNLFR